MAVPKGQKENRKEEERSEKSGAEPWRGSHPASRGREFHPRFDERDVDTRQMNERVDFLVGAKQKGRESKKKTSPKFLKENGMRNGVVESLKEVDEFFFRLFRRTLKM